MTDQDAPPVALLGLDFADLDVAAAACRLAARPAGAAFGYVVTPNADHLVRLARQPELFCVYRGALMRLLDSRVVGRAARLLGLAAPAVAPGSDLVARLLACHLSPGEALTVIGLAPAHLPALIRNCRLGPLAHHDPPAGFARDPAACARAVAFVLDHPARFVLLAVGSPQQEILAAAIAATGRATGLGLCVGAALEFLAGARARAPGWMQAAGLEWLHRLASEPRRLGARYLRDSPAVFALLLRARLDRRRRPGRGSGRPLGRAGGLP